MLHYVSLLLSYFYDWIIFLCVECYFLFIYLEVDEYLECFHLLAIMEEVAMGIYMQVFGDHQKIKIILILQK
jgi:hypothetical protein